MLRAACAILVLLAAGVVAATATAADAARLDAPRQRPLAGGSSVDPRVSLGPSRFDTHGAEAGDTLAYELLVRNTTDAPVRIRPLVLPIDGSRDPEEYATVGTSSSRSAEAVDWVRFPGFGESRTLPPSSELRVPVEVAIPADPPPGTVSLGLSVTWTVAAIGVDTADSPAGRVALEPTLTSVATIRLPGDAVPEARLRDIRAPRVVWGGDQPTFSARVENVGDTDLVIDAEVGLDAFFGTASRTLAAEGPRRGQPTLPGGVRVVEMRWSDPPLLGWFRPELVVVGGKGSNVRISKDLETIYVLPPWWLVLLLVLAILLPLRAARRQRRDPERREASRARARQRVEQRLRRDEARRRAEAARRRR